MAATFSPQLADITIYVSDVSAGDKIQRKGGLGITRSDLPVRNKIDPALYVGADLSVMDRDSRRMRGGRPSIFTDIRAGEGVTAVAEFVQRAGDLIPPRTDCGPHCAEPPRLRNIRPARACPNISKTQNAETHIDSEFRQLRCCADRAADLQTATHPPGRRTGPGKCFT